MSACKAPVELTTELRQPETAIGMAACCREALTAHGVCPGQWLCVLRTSQVTVVEVDQLELALEGELAELIELDQLECPHCRPDHPP